MRSICNLRYNISTFSSQQLRYVAFFLMLATTMQSRDSFDLVNYAPLSLYLNVLFSQPNVLFLGGCRKWIWQRSHYLGNLKGLLCSRHLLWTLKLFWYRHLSRIMPCPPEAWGGGGVAELSILDSFG